MKKLFLILFVMVIFGTQFKTASADPNDVIPPEPIEPFSTDQIIINY